MFTTHPLFSILIANHNNGAFFKDCYNSILAQTYIHWEVIIVDDCSTDNSVEEIRSLIANDSRFLLVVNEKNSGCGFTKRRCAELSKGFICGFLDPDDTLMPEALEQMVRAHLEHSSAALVHSTFLFCDEHMNPIHRYDRAGNVSVSKRFTNSERKVTAFATYKHSFYQRTTGIDSQCFRAVDQDLYLLLSEVGEFVFLDEALYCYRMHKNGISTAHADKALYWYLKVVAKAEERRSVNLEEEMAAYLNRTDANNLTINLSNPRYLLLRMRDAFKKQPAVFFRKLFGVN